MKEYVSQNIENITITEPTTFVQCNLHNVKFLVGCVFNRCNLYDCITHDEGSVYDKSNVINTAEEEDRRLKGLNGL